MIRISCKKKVKMKSIFLSWLKDKSKDYLKRRVSELSESIKINFQSVFVKTYKARWGCCNSNSEIFFKLEAYIITKKNN